jgi:hypothetical protein
VLCLSALPAGKGVGHTDMFTRKGCHLCEVALPVSYVADHEKNFETKVIILDYMKPKITMPLGRKSVG